MKRCRLFTRSVVVARTGAIVPTCDLQGNIRNRFSDCARRSDMPEQLRAITPTRVAQGAPVPRTLSDELALVSATSHHTRLAGY